ncbi:hypothetical protein QQX98_003403 [Neonectria punicea]|uniref:Mannose-1-phosphate guanylyltransferase n=1 Tax=Neonectria punicea TaxID=979145 RepID=A0ABR1HFB6_9HYPO
MCEVIEAPFTPDYGCNVIMGENCFVNFGLTILDTSLVIIGDRVQMGPNVSIYGVGYEASVLSRIKSVEFGHPVRIEDDCWIGGGVTILAGITIGRGCAIGANATVTKSIPPYSVALSAPAKTVEEELADPSNPYGGACQIGPKQNGFHTRTGRTTEPDGHAVCLYMASCRSQWTPQSIILMLSTQARVPAL